MSARAFTVEHGVANPMRDGTLLRSDVYLPRGSGPFPTLVQRTPYNKLRPSAIATFERLADEGYGVVVQDIRGRWASDGEFHPMFNADWTDAEDGYDTVEWAAAQPWSTGKIGTFGYSYGAWTQWALAPTKPPHLVTMFAGGMAPRTTDWEIGGVFRAGRATQWLLGSMAPDSQKTLPDPRGPRRSRITTLSTVPTGRSGYGTCRGRTCPRRRWEGLASGSTTGSPIITSIVGDSTKTSATSTCRCSTEPAGTTGSCGRWTCSRVCASPAPPRRRAAISGSSLGHGVIRPTSIGGSARSTSGQRPRSTTFPSSSHGSITG